MKGLIKKFKKIKKMILTVFLATNLTLISTGSATLNPATDSATLGEQATPSVSPSPQPTLFGQPQRTFKLDPTGSFAEDELIVKFKKDLPEGAKEGILSSHGASILKERKTKSQIIKVDT